MPTSCTSSISRSGSAASKGPGLCCCEHCCCGACGCCAVLQPSCRKSCRATAASVSACAAPRGVTSGVGSDVATA
eukprot:10498880-Lingulodinium_polyedra.AAC.1